MNVKWLALLLMLPLAGCSSFKASDVYVPGLAAAGGVLGYQFSKDESEGMQMASTALGGLGGYTIGKFIEFNSEDERVKEFKNGYNIGRSNMTKRYYWSLENYQQTGGKPQSVTTHLYSFPAPEEMNGVKYVPSDYTQQLRRAE